MSVNIIYQLAEGYAQVFQNQGQNLVPKEQNLSDTFQRVNTAKNDDNGSTKLPWWITGLAGLASSFLLNGLHQANAATHEEITERANRAFMNGTIDIQYRRYEAAITEFQKAHDLYSSIDSSFGRLKSLLALGKTQFLNGDKDSAKGTFNDANEILRTVNEKTWEKITELLDNGRRADALRVFNSAERFYLEATKFTVNYATFHGVNDFGLSKNVNREANEFLRSYTSSKDTFTHAITAEINSSNLFGKLNYKKSAESLGTAIEGYVSLGMYDQAVRCCRAQGEVWTMTRDHAAAAESYGKAFEYLETIERRERTKKGDYDIPKADLLVEIASSSLRARSYGEAKASYDHALALYLTPEIQYDTPESISRRSKIADMYQEKAELWLQNGKLMGWIESGAAIEKGLKYVPQHEGLLDVASRRIFSKQWLLDLVPPYLKPAKSAAMHYARKANALIRKNVPILKVAENLAKSARAWQRSGNMDRMFDVYERQVDLLVEFGKHKEAAIAYAEMGLYALKNGNHEIAQRTYLESAREFIRAEMPQDAIGVLQISLEHPVDPVVEKEAREMSRVLMSQHDKPASIGVAGNPAERDGRATIQIAGERGDAESAPLRPNVDPSTARRNEEIARLYEEIRRNGTPEKVTELVETLRRELNNPHLTSRDIAMAFEGGNHILQQDIARLVGKETLNAGWEVVAEKLHQHDRLPGRDSTDRPDRLEKYRKP